MRGNDGCSVAIASVCITGSAHVCLRFFVFVVVSRIQVIGGTEVRCRRSIVWAYEWYLFGAVVVEKGTVNIAPFLA